MNDKTVALSVSGHILLYKEWEEYYNLTPTITDTGLIATYSKAVFTSLPVAIKFLKENKKRIIEEFPGALIEFELNIYSRYLPELPEDVPDKILDIYLKKILDIKEIYHTSDSAIGYNILSFYLGRRGGEITSLLNLEYHDDRIIKVYNFLREQKTRFWWQLLLMTRQNCFMIREEGRLDQLLKEYHRVNDNLLKNGTDYEKECWEKSQDDMKNGRFGNIIKDFMIDKV